MNFGQDDGGVMMDDFSTPIDKSIIGNNRQLNGINMSEVIRHNVINKNNEDLHSIGFGGMRQSAPVAETSNNDPSKPSVEEMQRVYDSVQNGDLVAKTTLDNSNQVSNSINNQNVNQFNTNVQEQNNNAQNGLNGVNTQESSNKDNFGLDTDWLKAYVGNDKATDNSSSQNLNPTTLNDNTVEFNNRNNQVSNNVQQDNRQPLDNSTRVNSTDNIIAENERLLRTYGAKTGFKGDDLIATANSISEDEIAMLYRMRQQKRNEGVNNSIPNKQTPGPDVTGLGANVRQGGQRTQNQFSFTGMGADKFGI